MWSKKLVDGKALTVNFIARVDMEKTKAFVYRVPIWPTIINSAENPRKFKFTITRAF